MRMGDVTKPLLAVLLAVPTVGRAQQASFTLALRLENDFLARNLTGVAGSAPPAP